MLRNMTITALKNAYANNQLSPETLCKEIRSNIDNYLDHKIWIHVLSESEQAPYLEQLQDKGPATTPLWGIPFAIKDNIDLAGIPTTAGCEAFAYTPEKNATVVDKLIQAGAIPIGKTNLDQFATGLNGTRSPWGACKNAFKPEYISGGSSSGSSVAVALGLASFSLGTDTAGSGRVPACFNNLVGVKPSRGLLSSTGMLPACRSLDCISIFTLDLDDANQVLSVAEGQDESDSFSRKNPFLNQSRQFGRHSGTLTIGRIPDTELKFFGDDAYEHAYKNTITALSDDDTIRFVNIDYSAFDEAAKLLYEGPWVAERYLATQPLIDDAPESIFPVVRGIIEQGKSPKATELFKALYRLQELKVRCDSQMAELDCIMTPTAGRCFTIAEMLEEPVLRNSQLGHYTNYMNLLDYAALAVPTQMTDEGLPFGITLVGPAMSDRYLLSIANRIEPLFKLNIGFSDIPRLPTPQNPVRASSTVDIAVCGAHLSGLPLNWQLQERGATLKQRCKTANKYCMYALPGGPPKRPGLIKDAQSSCAIDIEIWRVPTEELGSFIAAIPAPLGIGKLELENGSEVSGFICEPYAVEGAKDISDFGSWKNYLASE